MPIVGRVLELTNPTEITKEDKTIKLNRPTITPVYRRVIKLIGPIKTIEGIWDLEGVLITLKE